MPDLAPGELPSFSIVVNTLNRAAGLARTLDSFRWLRYAGEVEVVVVNGPSTDDTEAVLERWRGRVKVGRVDVPNLSVSRNEGIRLAAGKVVAFIDDDAIPEPDWLTHLAMAYRTGEVAAAGGFVLDHTGFSYQYKFGVIDRFGAAEVQLDRPRPDLCYPYSWRVPHLLGTNSSYTRSVLAEIGGYDEFFEYFLDESDVQVRVADAGYLVAQAPAARVHHHFAPSHVRNAARATSNRYPVLKNKLYFSLKHGRAHTSLEHVLGMFGEFVVQQREDVRWCVAQGLLNQGDLERFEQDINRAMEDGLAGAARLPAPRALIGPPPEPLLAFERLRPEAPVRAVLVSQEYPPDHLGGIGTFTADVASGLSSQGNEIHVVTRSADIDRVDWDDGVWIHRRTVDVGRYADDPARGDVPEHLWAWASTVLDEVGRIEEIGPVDVVEAPIWDVQGIAVLRAGAHPLCLSLQTSMSVWLESQPERRADAEWMAAFGDPVLAAERELLSGATVIRAISKAVETRLETDYQVDLGGRSVVAPLGVRVSAPPASRHRARLEREPGRTTALYVGRLEERKGVDVLLDAFVTASAVDPDLRLFLVGDDSLPWAGLGMPIKDHFLDRALPDRVKDSVRFLGLASADQLERAYQNADLFVAPSRYESFGLVFVEAMAHGLPVVGTSVGGIPEVVRHGEDGLLVGVEDAEALAHAILRLSADPDLRAEMGRTARERYRTEFTAEAMAARTLDLYRRAVSAPGAPG